MITQPSAITDATYGFSFLVLINCSSIFKQFNLSGDSCHFPVLYQIYAYSCDYASRVNPLLKWTIALLAQL